MLDSIEQFSQLELSRGGIQSDAWMDRIVSEGNGTVACNYLEALGVDTVEGLGYAYAATLEKLAAVQPPTGVNIQEQARGIVEDGENRFAQGDLIGAGNLFRAALNLDVGNTDALNNLGVLHWQQDEAGRALEYLVQGLGIAPYDRSLVTNTVLVLHALNKHADAIALCRTYLEHHPEDDGMCAQLDTIEADQNMQNGYRQAR